MHVMEIIVKAFQLMENRQTKSALKLIEDHLPRANDDQKFAIAEFYLQWGFFEEALEILQDLIQKYPEESELKVLLANIYIELDNDKEAVHLLNDIREEDLSYEQALLQLADLYQSQGLFEVAEQKLLEAKRLNPDEEIIDLALGEFFFSIGEYKRAIIYYERIYEHTAELANISIIARLAEALAASGAYEKSLKLYQELEPDHPDQMFKYGLVAYHADRKDIAINVWNRVLEADKSYLSVYYELANAYQEEGMFDEAYETCQKGLQLDDFNKELFYLGAVLAHQLGKYEESEKLASNAIALDDGYVEAILFLIELYKEQDEYDKIIQLINDIKEQGSTDPIYDWELARAFNELESYSKAFKHYQTAYYYLNDNRDFLKEYGYFLTEDGKINDAMKIFTEYLKLEPTDMEMQEYIERLRQTNENEI